MSLEKNLTKFELDSCSKLSNYVFVLLGVHYR